MRRVRGVASHTTLDNCVMYTSFKINSRSHDTQIHDIQGPPSDAESISDTRSIPFDRVLDTIKTQGFKSLGHFLVELFKVGSKRGAGSKSVAQSVSSFLNGRTEDYDVIALVNILYDSRFSFPKAMRASKTPNEDKHRIDEEQMARFKLRKWAITVVEEVVDEEAEELVSKKSGLHLTGGMTWAYATGFSFHRTAEFVRRLGPTSLRHLEAVAIPSENRSSTARGSTQASSSSKPLVVSY